MLYSKKAGLLILSKWSVCFLVSLILAACRGDKEGVAQLELEKDSLGIIIRDLRGQIEEYDGLLNRSKVVIANTDVKEIASKYVDQKYQIKVSYPKSYFKDPSRKFPVLYVIDAETNFGGVSYIVQRLIKDELIPELLVVGIAYNTTYKNFYSLRSRDLTPAEDKQLKMGGHKVDPTGGAPDFCKFLEQELFPFIEANYKVENEDRALYGHSYGGLFGAFVLIDNPDLFNRYLLLGPSLWFKDKYMVKEAMRKDLQLTKDTRLYMASGEFDARINDFQEAFVDLLKSKEIPNLAIESAVVDNETHRTIFGIGFTNGLRFLYAE